MTTAALLLSSGAIGRDDSATTGAPTPVALTLPSAATVPMPTGIRLNEIRVTQPGTDHDEYVELAGPPGMPLDGLAYIVLGDDVGGSGCIEEIVLLDGQAVANDGLFLIAQASLSIGKRPADLVRPLNLENNDNLTHLLVEGFVGTIGMDLDPSNSGVLVRQPWRRVVDAVATITANMPPMPGAEWWYAPPVGPKRDGTSPSHVFRDGATGVWSIGPDDPAHGVDSAGAANVIGPPVLDDPGDVNGDGVVDLLDLWLLSLHWDEPWSLGDFDGDGIVGLGDLQIIIANWGMRWELRWRPGQ